jgi:predicted nucleic acid-binding protein
VAQIVRDPDDDHVFASALAAQANLIVSGDSDLLGLNIYQGIPIVSAAETLNRIRAEK